ncbi:uncharacterized protein VTP21DRAFT_2158 [Calcarisporiella thermophila]|uniref:uncharacterized protein n=1 Tax=Calcarisporiella thermophila TaxID=911321 RepID=UPI0037439B66
MVGSHTTRDPQRDKWLFPHEALSRTPSSRDGYSLDREKRDRAKGCNFINNVGLALKMPQITIATAMVFLHRFYMRYSLKDFHYYDIGGTCVFLASKVEETNRKIRDIITVCAQKALKKSERLELTEDSKEYIRWRDTILFNEEILLEALCFDLTIEHPYTSLIAIAKKLGVSKKLCQHAWGYINDSLRTPLCLIHRPETIAAAALLIGSTAIKEELPGLENGDHAVNGSGGLLDVGSDATKAAGKRSSWAEIAQVDVVAAQDAALEMLEHYQHYAPIIKSRHSHRNQEDARTAGTPDSTSTGKPSTPSNPSPVSLYQNDGIKEEGEEGEMEDEEGALPDDDMPVEHTSGKDALSMSRERVFVGE